MKLTDSEVLFLSQVLFQLKNTPSIHNTTTLQLSTLLKKCELHFLSTPEPAVEPKSEYCGWHDPFENSEFPYLEDQDESKEREKIKIQSFLNLESVRVTRAGLKLKLAFELGTSPKILDLTLDDGDEIMCDIVEITRSGETLSLNCAEGWVDFEVSKFPKSWTALLSPGVVYEVAA